MTPVLDGGHLKHVHSYIPHGVQKMGRPVPWGGYMQY